MQRPIKFRAWDKRNKELLGPWTLQEMLSEGYKIDGWYELMQYTGFKDKNGKEIYEGDILKCETSNRDYGGQVTTEVMYRGARYGVKTWAGIVDCLWNLSEVIGNVWETPELLNK